MHILSFIEATASQEQEVRSMNTAQAIKAIVLASGQGLPQAT
jgi:hypothetical protein